MISDITDSALFHSEPVPAALSANVSERILEHVLGRISSEPARVQTDAQGRVTEINPSFSGLCGYTFEEIRGRKPGSLLQGVETTEESIFALRDAIRSRRSCSVEMLNYHKNKSTYRVQIHLSPRFNDLGDLEGFEAEEHKLD